MDSGNSGGSMQSSSGGDEEFDSRAPESVLLPSFLNPSAHFVGSLSSSNPHHHHSSLLPHHQQLTFFDPSPNLFPPFSHSPTNPNPNSYLLRGLGSDPDCTDLSSNLPGSSAAASSIMGAHGSNHQGHLPSMQLRSVQDSSNNNNNNNGARSSSPSDQTHVVTRNPKKRTRASRRAPTTVLTTDTSNFRAMVQEFTGIPAPPFSGSPYSRRLDLFGSVGSGMRSGGHLEPIGSLYPLRPSALKVHQQSPFLFSSSSSTSSSSSFLSNNTMVDATNTTTATTSSNDTITLSIPSTTSTFNPSSVNYQLPSGLSLPKQQPQTMINMQNQMLSFQSLLQLPPPLHPSLDEVGMSLSGLPGQGTTERMRLRINDNNSSSWRDGNNGNGNQDHQLRSLDSCKLNYSASSSEFHQHEKGLENVPSRGEGTVDSWICPSE